MLRKWTRRGSTNGFLNGDRILVVQIKAITFDVGGTLIEPWPSVGHVYAEVASRHELNGISPESLNRKFAAAWRTQKNFKHTHSEWAELVKVTFQGLIASPPTKEMFADLYARFA